MDRDRADELGGYAFGESRFPPQGIEVLPDGTIPGQEIAMAPIHQNNAQHELRAAPAEDNTAPNNHLQQNNRLNPVVADMRRRPSRSDVGRDPTLPLNSRDVGAFIVNKMIGTGIFIQPPAVLLLTRSKEEALGLWILGFIYTLISTLLYLEFARKLPHTGGELIYLDETLPTPRLLAYTIYTFYFIFMYNTATNSMQFANQVLTSANIQNSTYTPDGRELRFLAIAVLTFFCLLHYFSAHAGRTVNQILALFKISLLCIVLVAGFAKAGLQFTPDWNNPSNSDGSSSAAAFLLIVFSFSGWENATFVTGEIRNHRILRRGFVGAILTVGILYILVNLAFLLAVPYSALIGDEAITAYVPFFFGNSLTAKLAWSVLIAFSASGSLISVIYTCARVKQVIGMSNIIPWSKFWESTSPDPGPRANSNGRSERPTPKGGLILHWIFSVILMSATSGMYDTKEAIGFPGNLQAYASGWVGIFISIAFPFLYINPIPLPLSRNWNDNPESFLVRTLTRKVIFSAIYILFNLYIVIFPLIPPYRNANSVDLEVKGWVYIVVTAAVVMAGIIYYILAFGYRQTTTGLNVVVPKRSIIRWANATPQLQENDTHDQLYGVRRWVKINYESPKPSYLYWFFGGRETKHYPNSTLIHLWDRLMGR